MPEIKHTFQAGRMNKDLDERILPNGEYRDAMNIDLANSENGSVGACLLYTSPSPRDRG